MDLRQVRQYIVRPALERIDCWSREAERLVMATGLAESGFKFIDQVESSKGDIKPGPAYGLFQMEGATHNDIWENYIRHNPLLEKNLRGLTLREMDLLY